MNGKITIYVADGSIEPLRDWAQRSLGPLHLVYHDPTHETTIYHSDREETWSVSLQTGIANGMFTEVVFRSQGVPLPWQTDIECARQAAQDLQTEIHCDPGSMGTNPFDPYEWWRIAEAQECLFSWFLPHEADAG